RDQATCLSGCTICNRACPSRIEVKKLTTVSSEACINCMSCVASCPTGVLAVRLPALPLPRSVKVEVPETIASGSRAE
ncbi:MAG TPA: 4Fe-4S dicluster domain-containing protein, partial [Chloroflexia bacterium]|nr:4Fe-4S dicluster domain-containing protein [Chloroflexia bacterium]